MSNIECILKYQCGVFKFGGRAHYIIQSVSMLKFIYKNI